MVALDTHSLHCYTLPSFQLLQDGASALAKVAMLGTEAGSIDSQDAAPAAPDVTADVAPPAEPAAAHPASAAPAAAGKHIAATPAAGGVVPDAAADATCVMCLDLPKDVILAPCGHQCLCRQAVEYIVIQPVHTLRLTDVCGKGSCISPTHKQLRVQVLTQYIARAE